MIDWEIKKEEKKNCKNSYYKRFVEKLEESLIRTFRKEKSLWEI